MKWFVLIVLVPNFLLYSQNENLDDRIEILFKKKDYYRAIKILKSNKEIYPEKNKIIELLGDAYGYIQKWDESISYYEELLSKDKTNADYYYKYGGSLGMKALSVSKFRALGIIGDVKDSFLKAAELDSTHIGTRWALVDLYVSLPAIIGGSNAKALRYAKELERISKIDGYFAQGYVYEYDDEPQLAKTFFKKAMNLSKQYSCSLTSNEKLVFTRNAMRYQVGKVSSDYNINLSKGEKCLKVYMQEHSSKDGVPIEWAYYRLAKLYRLKNEKQKALNFINKSISGLPKVKVFKKEKLKIQKL